MFALYPVLGAVALLGATFIILFRRMASRLEIEGSIADWLTNFSLESYSPMERLLDERDFSFLCAQPGYHVSIERALRTERKEVFKAYLHRLVRDFNQLLALAKLMMVYSAEDRPVLGKALFWQQITFYFAICSIRCRLAFYPRFDGAWQVRQLIDVLQRMKRELVVVAPPSEMA